MALVSMTGFAEAQGSRDGAHWRWEAKSVNGRGLDLRLRLPPGFDGVEAAARILAADRFKRGNIQASLTYEAAASVRGLRIDAVALASAVKIAKEVATETGLRPASVDGLLALKGIIVQDEGLVVDDRERAGRDAAILETLAAAFSALGRARASEGAKLRLILEAQIAEMARLIEAAAALAAAQPAALRDRLEQQLKDLVGAGHRFARTPGAGNRLAGRARRYPRGTRPADRACRRSAKAAVQRRGGRPQARFPGAGVQPRGQHLVLQIVGYRELTRVGLELKAVIDQFREQAQNVE